MSSMPGFDLLLQLLSFSGEVVAEPHRVIRLAVQGEQFIRQALQLFSRASASAVEPAQSRFSYRTLRLPLPTPTLSRFSDRSALFHHRLKQRLPGSARLLWLWLVFIAKCHNVL